MRVYKIFLLSMLTLSYCCKSNMPTSDVIELAARLNDENLYMKSRGFEDLIDAIKSLSCAHISNYSRDEIVQKTISGLLANLDPHTSYLNEKEMKALMEHTSGEFAGIGTQIALDNGLIRIINVLDGTPAYKGALRQGDYILCIDDEYINGIKGVKV